MNEKNYLIQFDYGDKTYSIHNLSHFDFTKGDFGDKIWIAETVENFIRSEELHIDGVYVNNIRLFGAGGELIVFLTDLSNIN